MAKTETLYPLPGTFLDRPLTIPISGSSRGDCSYWSEIKDWATWQFDAREDEIGSHEVYWGGEYGDDHTREVLTVKGEIVGVFDGALSPEQWRDMLAADSVQTA